MRIDKDLVAASATPLVLGILAEGESYGYAILEQVNELSRGRMQWTDGMLYPLLHRLERLGLRVVDMAGVRGRTSAQALRDHRFRPSRARRTTSPVERGRRRTRAGLAQRDRPGSRRGGRDGADRAARRRSISGAGTSSGIVRFRSPMSTRWKTICANRSPTLRPVACPATRRFSSRSSGWATWTLSRASSPASIPNDSGSSSFWCRRSPGAVRAIEADWWCLALAVGAALAVKAGFAWLRRRRARPQRQPARIAVPRRILRVEAPGFRRVAAVLLVPFTLAALVLNLYPFEPDGSTEIIAAIHAPIAAVVAGRPRLRGRRLAIRAAGGWISSGSPGNGSST